MRRRQVTVCTIAVAASILLSSCTFGVQELSDTRSATYDKPGWNTFAVRASDMTGGVSVLGTAASFIKADATVAALLSSASKEEAFGGASLEFVHTASRLSLALSTSGDHAELIYFQKLAIETPATINLDIDADDTDVTVTDMAGNVLVKTGSGSATVTTGGSADITASSGNVTISAGFKATVDGGAGSVNVVAGSVVDIKTSSGSVQADTPTGGKFIADSGAIDVRLTSPNFGAAVVQTTSGDLILRVPKGAKYDLDAFSQSGPMTIEVGGLIVTDTYNGPVNGGGPLVLVRTTSGSLTVVAE